MIKVFISSPYSIGDQAVNVKRHIDAADELIRHGFAPYAPLLSHFHHLIHPHDYETWMELDHEWLKVCDCLLRLPGESIGSDREASAALLHKIPVFHSVIDLVLHFKVIMRLGEGADV